MSKTIEDANGIDWCQRAIDGYLSSTHITRTKRRLHMSEAVFIEAMEQAFGNGFMTARFAIDKATTEAVRQADLQIRKWREQQHKRTAGKGKGRR